MIRAAWRRGPLRIQEIHFPTDPGQLSAKADLLVVIQASFPVTDSSAFHTQWIDLTRPCGDVEAGMSATTRNEVRRARRDHEADVAIRDHPTRETIDQFVADHAAFSRRKHLRPVRGARLHALAPALVLVTSRSAGQPVVSQAYLRDESRLRLLLSMSYGQPRSSTSRINRLAHVCAMQWARAHGLQVFDLGGLALDRSELQGVDAFKRGFGGDLRTEWNAIVPVSPIGRLALRAADAARPAKATVERLLRDRPIQGARGAWERPRGR